MSKVPLFLLNTVLFPGGQIVLHVFEERYRLMINRCLQENRPFGIALIKEGPEVGGPAVPYSVGTMANITSAYGLSDGRIYLTASGLHRFRIQYMLQSHPYPTASVTALTEESGEPLQDLAAEVTLLYDRYRTAIANVTGSGKELDTLPGDPLAMSYVLASRMNVPLQHKQRWLEADVATRLREVSAALTYELRLLPDPGESGNQPQSGGPWN